MASSVPITPTMDMSLEDLKAMLKADKQELKKAKAKTAENTQSTSQHVQVIAKHMDAIFRLSDEAFEHCRKMQGLYQAVASTADGLLSSGANSSIEKYAGIYQALSASSKMVLDAVLETGDAASQKAAEKMHAEISEYGNRLQTSKSTMLETRQKFIAVREGPLWKPVDKKSKARSSQTPAVTTPGPASQRPPSRDQSSSGPRRPARPHPYTAGSRTSIFQSLSDLNFEQPSPFQTRQLQQSPSRGRALHRSPFGKPRSGIGQAAAPQAAAPQAAAPQEAARTPKKRKVDERKCETS